MGVQYIHDTTGHACAPLHLRFCCRRPRCAFKGCLQRYPQLSPRQATHLRNLCGCQRGTCLAHPNLRRTPIFRYQLLSSHLLISIHAKNPCRWLTREAQDQPDAPVAEHISIRGVHGWQAAFDGNVICARMKLKVR